MTVRAIDGAGWPVLLADRVAEDPAPVESASSLGARRRDVVRELAREFEDLSDQDLREMLPAEVSKALSAGDLMVLRHDVRAQVIDDLVDVLDQRHRGKLRARRTVRLLAPRGYVRKAVAGLSVTERTDIASRLSARGWSADDVRRALPPRRSII